MSKQKQSRVDLVEKKIQAITNVLQGIINDMNNMREFSIGTFRTLELMEGYDKAFEKLQDNLKKENEANEEEKKFEGLDD